MFDSFVNVPRATFSGRFSGDHEWPLFGDHRGDRLKFDGTSTTWPAAICCVSRCDDGQAIVKPFVMVPHEQIITAFRQHGFGNCTSIGVIKAAIEVWGITGIWTETEAQGARRYQLKDGRSVLISEQEAELARSNCGFQLLEDTPTKHDILKTAQLAFSIICKVKQEMQQYSSYQEAIDDVNGGEGATDAPRFLGLEDFQEYISYDTCFGVGGVVAHSVHHTVYVSHGDFDDYGEVNALNSIREWIRFARQMYRLRG